jgi:hypothetical protein
MKRIRCHFCAKLPVLYRGQRGKVARCPVCKQELFVAWGSGTTYRFPAAGEANPENAFTPSWKLAIALGAIVILCVIGIAGSPLWEQRTVPSQALAPYPNHPRLPGGQDQTEIERPQFSQTRRDGQSRNLPSRISSPKPSRLLPHLLLAVHLPPTEKLASSSKTFTQAKGEAKEGPALVRLGLPRAKARGNPAPSALLECSKWKSLSEQELLAQLQNALQVSLDEESQACVLELDKQPAYLYELKGQKPGLAGLPFVRKGEYLLSAKSARDVAERSLVIRGGLNASLQASKQTNGAHVYSYQEVEANYNPDLPRATEGTKTFQKCLDNYPELIRQENASRFWQEANAVVPLQQLLMAEDKPFRRLLVAYLTKIKDRTATAALARRVVFDLDAENREAATRALKDRPCDEYTAILLAGLRYPWPAAAYHAAQALADLKRSDLVSDLVAMLDEPDPDIPFREGGKPKIRELVRINHHRNCFLCHAPSFSARDLIRGRVPSPDQPLPDLFGDDYVAQFARLVKAKLKLEVAALPESSLRRANGTFIRADITFLRQDFSALLPVEKPGAWPAKQRFDFLVRVRELKKGEMTSRLPRSTRPASEYKRAILFALRELTGLDADPTAAAWKEKLVSAAKNSDPR